MKFKILALLFFTALSAVAQQTYLDFMNNSVPLYPGCTKYDLRYDHYAQSVATMVLDSVNAYHKTHPIADDRVEVTLMLSARQTGEIKVQTVKCPNAVVAAIAQESLKKLPLVIPAYKPEGTPASVATGFVVVLQKDKQTGLFKHEYQSKNNEWRAKPNPMPMAIIDAAFPGCNDSKSFGSCFEEKFFEWLLPKLSSTTLSEIKGKIVVFRITINEEGGLHGYELLTAVDSLKKEANTVMKSFPKVTPSTVGDQPYMATYVFSILVK